MLLNLSYLIIYGLFLVQNPSDTVTFEQASEVVSVAEQESLNRDLTTFNFLQISVTGVEILLYLGSFICLIILIYDQVKGLETDDFVKTLGIVSAIVLLVCIPVFKEHINSNIEMIEQKLSIEEIQTVEEVPNH